MSLADELREQQRIQQSKKYISDEEVYQYILQREYNKLLEIVKKQASLNPNSSIILGQYGFRPEACNCSIQWDLLEHRESDYHLVYGDEYGPAVSPKGVCITKHNTFLGTTKVSLSQFGKRLTEDIIRLGQKDGLRVWFTPGISNYGNVYDLKKFDVITTNYGEGFAVLHYEIKI